MPVNIAGATAALNELRAAINVANPPVATVFLYANLNSEDHEKWRRVRLSNDLASDFKWALIHQLQNTTEPENLRPYSFEGMIEGGLGVWDLDVLTADHGWPYAIPPLDWPHIFDGTNPHLKKIELLVSVLPFANGKNLVCYRKQTQNTLIKRPNKLAAMLDPHDHIFTRPHGTLFQLDYRCDFFEWDGKLYILSQSIFESLTHIATATKGKAQSALDRLEQIPDLEIENFDDFSEAVLKRTRSMRRLANAEYNGILASITIDDVERCIDEVGLNILFEKEGNKLILSPDTENGEELDNVVKVLVDYFTRGLSSQTIYATDVKHPVG